MPQAAPTLLASAAMVAEKPSDAEWRCVAAELRELDGVVEELRAELRQLEARRRALAAREAKLRPSERCDDAPLFKPPMRPPPLALGRLSELSRSDDSEEDCVSELPGPQMFEIADEEDADGNLVFTPRAPPSARELPVRSPRALDAAAVSSPAAQVPAATPRRLEDWERRLDVMGVAKCGVCGTKLPLDTALIEKHCLECEASSTRSPTACGSSPSSGAESGAEKGASPMRSLSLLEASPQPPRDRASLLRARLSERMRGATA